MYKILIIEDNEKIRMELSELLKRYGYEPLVVTAFENVIEEIKKAQAHLILLDINLPLYDGYYICREIRKDLTTPIIIVTSRDSEMDELMSMNLGADDFVTKPYNTQILLARVAALIKRTYAAYQEVMAFRNFQINFLKGVILKGDEEVELTKNERKILSCLSKEKGNIVTREELMKYLWDSEWFVDDNTLTVNINRLRKKFESIGVEDVIQTKRGQGYLMQ
ncbi:response regulator transcription factor [Zhenhengia yiwuensis]|uniref:Stage 0 sporulation protein A homolog n=1 Tax=Zhenhengia yiwuensis TaxID=2763666 RepID=A0A926EF67_9FIRM|nr:response regulator transcription factor [Zhenhengia yiwuensis]MBC8579193.1 response regulator transcription factor [Zhenhengia yiwuensis]